jgi:HNH endonuclease
VSDETKPPRCIFCGRDDDLTDEHVFPAFMGGTLEVVDGSCTSCNGSFHHWEGDIKKDTSLLLHLIQVGNRRDIVPNAPVDVTIRGMEEEALSGLRTPEGDISLQDKVRDFVSPEGKKARRGFFASKKSAERFIARAKARGEKTTELPIPEEITYDASFRMTIAFCKTLATRKVIAKIALAAIAYKYGTEYALSPQFAKLRETRNATSIQGFPVEIFCNSKVMASQTRTIHQHSVICYLSAGQKKGWCIVTLFGGFTYLVQATDAFEETSSREFSIHFDALTKKTFNPIVLAGEMSLIELALSKDSVVEDSRAIDSQWAPILESYCSQEGIKLERVRSH